MGESQGSNTRVIWFSAFLIGWAVILPVFLVSAVLARSALGAVGLIAVVLPIGFAGLAARAAFRRGAPQGIWGAMLLGALPLAPAIYRTAASSGEPVLGMVLIASVVVAPPLVVAMHARRRPAPLAHNGPAQSPTGSAGSDA